MDGKGDQLKYEKYARKWYDLQEKRSEKNINCIVEQNLSIVLLFNLYGHLRDFFRRMEDEVIYSAHGSELIVEVETTYKRYPLSVVSTVQKELKYLLGVFRYHNEY